MFRYTGLFYLPLVLGLLHPIFEKGACVHLLEIKSLADIRGNTVAIYSIQRLIERKSFPKLSIMHGVMGVGKSSIARVVANEINESEAPTVVYNFGASVDVKKLQEEVFSLKPMKPRVFIFEELHGMPKNEQEALLALFDSQSENTYIICTTTELHKVLNTIKSRAQVWEFKLLSEKQCAQLLDDYLESRGVTLNPQSKHALLRSCRGVPRDLIKNADFAIEGEFTTEQLNSLLGNVSDEILFTVFASLKSDALTFVSNVEALMDAVSDSKLSALSDFWLRFVLEKSGGKRITLTKEMLSTLSALFSDSDIVKVSKVLLRSKPDTLLLELVTLNMALTSATSASVLGSQRTVALQAESNFKIEKQEERRELPKTAKLTAEFVTDIKI